MLPVTSAAATDPGLRREINEDSLCARADLGLYLVADGMGGHAAGEVASKLAVEVIEAFINDTREADPNQTWPFPYDPALSLDANRIKYAFRLANHRLTAAMEADDALRGMATTAAALLIGKHANTPNQAPVVAHVGDSRIYLRRDGKLKPITQDHSWVGEQVRAGLLSENDARRHPWRNVVTRAIAGGDDPEVEISEVPVQPGDQLLLCSDGLCSVVAPEMLEEIVARNLPLDETCKQLIAAANEAGGPDNITVVMVTVGRSDVA
jgi:serine/threonine protein phosphatase PrpC